ncbi:MAG: adenylyltransferase/cytidyltransferase family protein [Deltaproteobacteria bacterium]|nr:adenylyltransferase/cytidyltransferase family protein [Deltaproteobacteria bacterium]
MGRVLTVPELVEEVNTLRQLGKRIAFANGHFDLLHVGHLRYLQDSRNQGDALVVGINSDASVASLKGAGRPIVPAQERAELLAGLTAVDYVVIFEGDSPASLLLMVEPEVHCKGPDYGSPEEVPEYQAVRSYGGSTRLVGDPKDHNTTDIIAAVKALPS